MAEIYVAVYHPEYPEDGSTIIAASHKRSLLQAVIENDWNGKLWADRSGCYGSPEKFQAWMVRGGLEGQGNNADD